MSAEKPDELLAGLLGRITPGGCDDCDAEQEMIRPDPDEPLLIVLQVRHDDGCPFLAGVTR